MHNLKISYYKLQTGQHVISFIDPITKRKVRKKFKKKIEADDYKSSLEKKFIKKGAKGFNMTPIATLMQIHLKKCPDSKVTDRKNSFLSFCNHFGHFKIGELKKSDLEYWFIKIKKEHDYSDRTLSHIKSMLNNFFKFLVSEEVITHSPLADIKFAANPPARRQRVVLSVSEVKTLLDFAYQFDKDYLYPFLFTIVNTGARRGEVIKLKRSDVDFATGFINFRNTKNGEDRSVCMGDSLKELLQNYLQSHNGENAFVNQENLMIGRTQIQRWIKKFKTHYPMSKDWGLHALRHSFAFNYLRKGGQMYQLQAILGHKTIGMTVDLYGQIKSSDLKQISPYDEL